ncbi:MAG: hypothetical protein JWQ49_2540 [Edaphobacter sp.]|nr:hypothetical protein [Edaphobacter sp.]
MDLPLTTLLVLQLLMADRLEQRNLDFLHFLHKRAGRSPRYMKEQVEFLTRNAAGSTNI